MKQKNQISHVLHRKHKRSKPVVTHGAGITLFDEEGRQYIDASGGAIVANLGHGVFEIADAIGQQAAAVGHAHPTMFTSQPVEELARLLAERLPIPDARLFFLTSGSEAVETAIKFSREAQIARGEDQRYKVIGRWGSYHGGTMGALAVMGKPSMRKHFEPQFKDMPHIPPVYCYRCPFGQTYPDCGLRCADALAEEIKHQGAHTVAAFIAEPVSGATLGAVVPPDGYWQRIREICDHYGVLLIADEVMSGMGRTGRWFAVAQWGVQPDVITMGKGISGGYVPLSAAAMRGDLVDLLWEKLGDFNHGGTYSHHPVTAAAGVATVNYMVRRDLVDHAESMGEVLGRKLRAAFDDHPQVGDIRGQGLMWGLELVADRESKAPYPPAVKLFSRVFDRAFTNGLIVYTMGGCVDGVSGDHLMIAPPLGVTEMEIDEIVRILRWSLDEVIENL